MSQTQIRPVESDALPQALRLLGMLNPEVAPAVVWERVKRILAEHPHYRLYGAFEDDCLVGVCGAWIATKVWCGRYLEVDNIVVDPQRRSDGVGTRLMEEMERMAREADCQILVLDSYTGNQASHRLYHRLGYEIKGFHFVKVLDETFDREVVS